MGVALSCEWAGPHSFLKQHRKEEVGPCPDPVGLGQDPLSPEFVLHLNRPGEVPSWAEIVAMGRYSSLSFFLSLLGDLSLKDLNSKEVTTSRGCSLHRRLGGYLEVLIHTRLNCRSW